MLQYKNFKFSGKEEFISYIENRMIDYWKAHNDSFSRVCEELDSWDGFLGDDKIYPMDEFGDIFGDKKLSEVLQMVDTANFNYSDDYFYYDIHGDIHGIRSTNEKKYYNYVDYSDVFKKLINDYNQVFTRKYGHEYFELFHDVDDIIKWDEDEIQDYMNDDYYDYIFVDDDDFFWRDDLDD